MQTFTGELVAASNLKNESLFILKEEHVAAAWASKAVKPHVCKHAERHPANCEWHYRPITMEQQHCENTEYTTCWHIADRREEEKVPTPSIILPLSQILAHVAFSVPDAPTAQPVASLTAHPPNTAPPPNLVDDNRPSSSLSQNGNCIETRMFAEVGGGRIRLYSMAPFRLC
jgi:hypothetical protein